MAANLAPRTLQHQRIEVTLDSTVRPDLFPGPVERHTPIDADDVCAECADPVEHSACSRAEVNHGDAGLPRRLDDLLVMRRDVTGVIVWAERPDPRIEQLYSRRARLNLLDQV